MAALTDNKRRKTRQPHLKVMGGPRAVQTTGTVYQGSFLSVIESTGRATAGDNVAGETFLGVCEASGTKTGNTGGTVKVPYSFGHEVLCTLATAVTKAYEGCNLALADDDTLTTLSGAGTAGVQVVVGMLTEWVAANSGYVWIKHFSNKSAP